KASKPAPLAEKIIGADGKEVTLGPAPADDAGRQKQVREGRRLFTEKGCLACHTHGAMLSAQGDLPAVPGDANFGPNLSRLAAKLGPEKGGPEARRRWLVQWVMNPWVHSPRTRMPITHLTPEQADAIASWLLSQQADYQVEDVPAPSTDTLERLAQLWLLK